MPTKEVDLEAIRQRGAGQTPIFDFDGVAKYARQLEADRDALLALVDGKALPMDVVRLVIAAREVAFVTQDREAIKELDEASEAFAERVAWEDDPNDEEPVVDAPETV